MRMEPFKAPRSGTSLRASLWWHGIPEKIGSFHDELNPHLRWKLRTVPASVLTLQRSRRPPLTSPYDHIRLIAKRLVRRGAVDRVENGDADHASRDAPAPRRHLPPLQAHP